MSASLVDRSRLVRFRGPVLVAVAGAAAVAALRLRDPHIDGSWGFCPFLLVTGRPCPGCGGLRAVHDLTRGDVAAAISSNLLAVALVVVLAAAWVLWVVRTTHGRSGPMIRLGRRTGLVVIAAILLFGVVRNLPIGAGLAP